MPSIFCIGSVNVDHMYRCSHVVKCGESIPSISYGRLIGGKGLNQAYALFKAGVETLKYHGILGGDGEWMIPKLKSLGFPSENIKIIPDKESGHTIIQLQEHHDGGENAVLLHYGANHMFTEEMVKEILDTAVEGDILLMQGETNLIDYAMQYAHNVRKMTVVFNPAPYPPKTTNFPTEYPCDYVILNTNETEQILNSSGYKGSTDSKECLQSIMEVTGARMVIVTLGAKGCRALMTDGKYYSVPAVTVDIVDTTGAGDVFMGYFLSALTGGWDVHIPEGMDRIEFALSFGNTAAALAVTKMGALSSVPSKDDVYKLWQSNFLVG